eukprot:3830947-Pyramimonas_sp.AAC.1
MCIRDSLIDQLGRQYGRQRVEYLISGRRHRGDGATGANRMEVDVEGAEEGAEEAMGEGSGEELEARRRE